MGARHTQPHLLIRLWGCGEFAQEQVELLLDAAKKRCDLRVSSRRAGHAQRQGGFIHRANGLRAWTIRRHALRTQETRRARIARTRRHMCHRILAQSIRSPSVDIPQTRL